MVIVLFLILGLEAFIFIIFALVILNTHKSYNEIDLKFYNPKQNEKSDKNNA